MKAITSFISGALLAGALALTGCSDKSDQGSNDSSGAVEGQGGSMARFAIAGDMLYTVSSSTLKQFDISNPSDPRYYPSRDMEIGSSIETIFPMDTLLFIGSREGMSIYDIRDPRFPNWLSDARHLRSCDPVVVEGDYAYVTLNTVYSWCGASNNNVLQVYDVHNPLNPKFLREIQLRGPQGLGADGHLLFVCDDDLKVFDISTPQDPASIKQIGDLAEIEEVGDITAYDVIPSGGLLILVADEGLYLLDYTNFDATKNLTFLSKITVK